jgi:hypothetical protein
MKANALEGDCKLGTPTLICAARSHEPNSIPLSIDLAVFDTKSVDEPLSNEGCLVCSYIMATRPRNRNSLTQYHC